MLGVSCELEKFNGMNNFELCWIKMKALLVQHGLEGALEGESKLPATLSLDEKIMMDLTNVNIKISDEDQALLLLSTLFEFYESLVITMLYRRTRITLKDVKVALNSKEVQNKVFGDQGSDGEGPVARDRVNYPRRKV
ncbi:hypothetical protein CRG98_031382 [Punica granatum]|uniref:Uncharacterized protein n=1 Tax=Punica granatum TaxID=22663 RepID=A0A2I0IW50_PUNGR|nr:hypothetical protein CRG98_031382 [Punica granatum]